MSIQSVALFQFTFLLFANLAKTPSTVRHLRSRRISSCHRPRKNVYQQSYTQALPTAILEVFQLLVKHGADLEEAGLWWFNPTAIDADKWGTASYHTAYKGQQEPLAYLLDKGVSIWFKDKKGQFIL